MLESEAQQTPNFLPNDVNKSFVLHSGIFLYAPQYAYTLRHQDLHNIVQLILPQMCAVSTSWIQPAVQECSYIGLDFSNPSPQYAVASYLYK
jgi:hypothetical protein